MNSSDIENEDGEEEESVHYLALEALKEIMAVPTILSSQSFCPL
jgi:hypothetical protein